uniref:Uncharacterized protein n=1 Tax=Candidatus Methanophaga sp. ANME-1 ERB7 TaxID=2759913 RepID=A0A7G9Z1T2_9EURY|nr:hypothetical protein IEMLPNFH_00017 [Methanosarcinales archaeon ANME-1 ERB7]
MNATISSGISVTVSVASMPIKLRMTSGMIAIPTMRTTRPVTSVGNRARRRCIIRERRTSKEPAMAVMPKRRESPPVCAARSDAGRYEGPQTEGQRYPEPIPFFFNA